MSGYKGHGKIKDLEPGISYALVLRTLTENPDAAAGFSWVLAKAQAATNGFRCVPLHRRGSDCPAFAASGICGKLSVMSAVKEKIFPGIIAAWLAVLFILLAALAAGYSARN